MTQAFDSSSELVWGDRYQALQQLGKKAGRQTWLAQDLQTQEQVVIKLLTFNNDFNWEDLKLFEREAETLKSLDHPFIPRYLDYFELEDPQKGFALVQTYIPARSLEQHLKAGRSFSTSEVKQLAIQLLKILTYLHDRQPPVVHRDLKPSNILLTDRRDNSPAQVYLVDFGSVQTLAAREGGTITVVGTYGYMPPEQFGGRAVPASDLYSLGATLICLVTGKHPADLLQADLRIAFGPSTPTSPTLVKWLQWLTEPSLMGRPASAQEALQGLDSRGTRPVKEVRKPVAKPLSSKIVIDKQEKFLEVILPSRRISLAQELTLNKTLLILLSLILVFPGLIFLLIAVVAVPVALLSQLLGKTRIRIDRQKLFVTRELFGWPINRMLEVPKRHAWKLEKLTWSNKMTLWIGTQHCEIRASETELEWLAYELSDRLDLPISRDYFLEDSGSV